MLAVAASARASAALPREEDTLSRELGTPLLPEAHSPVGYCWQNSRCCRPLRGLSTATSTTSCRTRTSQPFPTAAFPVLVRAGAGSRPYRRRHALGESDGSLPIARSFEKTRRPRFLSPSNKARATAPFPSGMVGRFPEAPFSCSSRRAGLSDGYGPCSTTSGPRLLMSRWPNSTGAQRGS